MRRRRPAAMGRAPRLGWAWCLVLGLFGCTGLSLAEGQAGVGAGGFTGFVAARGGRVLEAENASGRFVPGSVSKLVVATAALHHLGPEFRVTTRLRAAGAVAGEVLEGDLILEAAADPTWNRRFHDRSSEPLEHLVRQLRQRGLRRITGDLILDSSRFPGRSLPGGRSVGEVGYAFAAPATALALDENMVTVEIAPGRRVGSPGTALSDAPGLTLDTRIRTVGRHRHGRGTVDFWPDHRAAVLRIAGEYPISEPSYRVAATLPSPVRWVGETLERLLAQQGVTLLGEVRQRQTPAPAAGEVLASIDSPPLAEWLPPILTKSHNWYAEMLLRVLAAAVQGEGRIDAGLELEARFLEEVVGIAPEAFHLADGSGLSRTGLLSPAAVVRLLEWAWQQPWRKVLVASLARPGEGTLEAWPDLPPLAAKTGSVTHALGLAGFLAPDSPRPVAFAVFLQSHPGSRRAQRLEIARRLRRWAPQP